MIVELKQEKSMAGNKTVFAYAQALRKKVDFSLSQKVVARNDDCLAEYFSRAFHTSKNAVRFMVLDKRGEHLQYIDSENGILSLKRVEFRRQGHIESILLHKNQPLIVQRTASKVELYYPLKIDDSPLGLIFVSLTWIPEDWTDLFEVIKDLLIAHLQSLRCLMNM